MGWGIIMGIMRTGLGGDIENRRIKLLRSLIVMVVDIDIHGGKSGKSGYVDCTIADREGEVCVNNGSKEQP